MIDPKLVRIQIIVDSINAEIEKREIPKTKVADNMGVSQPAIIPFLNMKRFGSDDYYKKIMKGIPLTDNEIKKIFQKADEEEYKYKYGKEIEVAEKQPEFKVAFRREFGKLPTEKDMEILRRLFAED